METQLKTRKLKNQLFKWLVIGLACSCGIPLFFIIFYILQKGFKALNWEFFTQVAKPVGETGGGIADALVGTILLVLLAVLLAVPIGIFAGVYLAENPAR